MPSRAAKTTDVSRKRRDLGRLHQAEGVDRRAVGEDGEEAGGDSETPFGGDRPAELAAAAKQGGQSDPDRVEQEDPDDVGERLRRAANAARVGDVVERHSDRGGERPAEHGAIGMVAKQGPARRRGEDEDGGGRHHQPGHAPAAAEVSRRSRKAAAAVSSGAAPRITGKTSERSPRCSARIRQS